MADGKASEVAKGIRKFARHVSDLFIKNPAKRFGESRRVLLVLVPGTWIYSPSTAHWSL